MGLPNEFQLSFEIKLLVYSLRCQKPFCLSDLIKTLITVILFMCMWILSVVLFKISLNRI